MKENNHDWLDLIDSIDHYLAPSMAKDHPNLPVVKAEGCYYYGIDGKKYLDFTSGIAVENVGHRHPEIVKAIKESADNLIHGPSGVIIYESILRLAEQLQKILPPKLDNFFFGNSGTEAVEASLKLAKYVTKRPYVISFTGGFHGRTIGSLSVSTSKSKYRKYMHPSLLTYQLPYPRSEECPQVADPELYFAHKLEQDVDALFRHQVDPEEVACMIVEPILGEGGYVIPPQSWLKKVREICDRHGILLIFDEIQTGFGRTGNWFAAQTFDVTPDIMAVAKGVAAGLPLGVTIASKELMKQWPMGAHSTTFGGNPIACAAGIASIRIIEEEKLLQNSREMGKYALARLENLQEKFPMIHDVRGVGLMIGIELRNPASGEPDGEAVMKVLKGCLEKGVLFYLCGNASEVIRMIPPLIITKEQLDEGINLLEEVLEDIS